MRSAGESLVVIVGDALTNAYFSFEKPSWQIGSDQDAEKGVETRKKLLDQLTHQKMQMIAYHIPYPGIGRAEKAGDAYRFIAG